MEYIFTDLPRYVKTHNRTEFADSVIQEGHVLLFTEDGTTLTAKLPGGEFISVGGSVPDDLTATAAAVRSGYTFIGVDGTEQTGTMADGEWNRESDKSITLTAGYYDATTIPYESDIPTDLTAAAAAVRSGYTFIGVDGTEQTGTMADGSWRKEEDGSIMLSAGYYHPQTIPGGGTIPDDLTATAAAVRSGYTFIGVDGAELTGTMANGTATANGDGTVSLTEGFYTAQTIQAGGGGGGGEPEPEPDITTGLIFHAPMSASATVDATGNHTLTESSGISFMTLEGVPCASFSFADDAQITSPCPEDFPFGDSNRTLSEWVYLNAPRSDAGLIGYGRFCSISSHETEVEYDMRLADGWHNESVHLGPGNIPIGEWCHVVCVTEDQYDYIYINGEMRLKTRNTRRRDEYASNCPIFLGSGRDDDTAGKFDGFLAGARIYSRALTATDIKYLYENEYHPAELTGNLTVTFDQLNDMMVNDYGYDADLLQILNGRWTLQDSSAEGNDRVWKNTLYTFEARLPFERTSPSGATETGTETKHLAFAGGIGSDRVWMTKDYTPNATVVPVAKLYYLSGEWVLHLIYYLDHGTLLSTGFTTYSGISDPYATGETLAAWLSNTYTFTAIRHENTYSYSEDYGGWLFNLDITNMSDDSIRIEASGGSSPTGYDLKFWGMNGEEFSADIAKEEVTE